MLAFKKILFPTDFSTNADRALAHAIRLADFESGEVIVQHVVGDYFERHPHWATLFDVHEIQKLMDGYVEAHVSPILPKNTGNVRLRTVLSKGKPAHEISALADRERVDLVIMGSAKGVVTNKVIRMTNQPVMAISGIPYETNDDSSQKIKKILIATDFSEHSKKIMRYAFDLKRIFDASIYMLYVIETTRAIEFAVRQGRFSDVMEKMREWANNQLLNLTPDEFIHDPTVVRLVEAGPADDTIADVAAEVGANLTIVGTHEYGMASKRLIGTTTDRLLTKISSPILAVKV